MVTRRCIFELKKSHERTQVILDLRLAFNGKAAAIELLHEKGMDITVRNNSQYTPLDYAVNNWHINTVKTILRLL